jgi:hypothetical protein
LLAWGLGSVALGAASLLVPLYVVVAASGFGLAFGVAGGLAATGAAVVLVVRATGGSRTATAGPAEPSDDADLSVRD